MEQKDCIFCKIVRKEIPSTIVYEDDKIIAFKDVSPKAPVHILMVPRKHIPGVTALADEDKDIVAHIMLTSKQLAKDFSIFQCGFRIVVNSGPDAGQAVDHLHFHLLGGRTLNWPPG